MSRPRIALSCIDASTEPTDVARSTVATARALAVDAEVTVLAAPGGYAAGAAAVVPDVRVVLVEEPAAKGAFHSLEQRRSARVLDALRSAYGARGPDYAEFPDRGGEGAVTVQARRTCDPFLAATCIGVRAWGTDEMLRVLDGWLPDDRRTRLLHELERSCLRDADVRLVPSADVEPAYARFYAEEALVPATVVQPAAEDAAPVPSRPPLHDRPLRLLYAGPLDRRSGVASLVDALLGLDGHDGEWRLTIAGPDRSSASLGGSMRDALAMTIAGDLRIELLSDDGTDTLPALLADHDVLALPSRWDCWPPAALDALRANRPLLASPVGGLTELAVPGASGWCSAGTAPHELAAAVARLLDEREALEALVREEHPRAVGERLADTDGVRAAYAAMLETTPRARPRPAERTPLVSVVVPYFRLAPFVERAVASAFDQTHREIEVLIVDDGSAEGADAVLDRLASRWPVTLLTQENQGVGAARNLGIAQARGRYVLPLDADNELDPSFVARAVATLEADPRLAYVSAWTTFVDHDGAPVGGACPGYRPLGARGPELDRQNVAADAVAVLARRVFEDGFAYRTDLVSFEDWLLYRQLRDAGRHGAVIPEPLVRYRVRADSKLRTMGLPSAERLAGELRAHQRERRGKWTRTHVTGGGGDPAPPSADVAVAPMDVRAPERANAELLRANARLRRSLAGRSGAAAAAQLARQRALADAAEEARRQAAEAEARVVEVERRAEAAEARVVEVERRAEAAEARVVEVEQRATAAEAYAADLHARWEALRRRRALRAADWLTRLLRPR